MSKPRKAADNPQSIVSNLWGRIARERSGDEEWKRLYWQSHPLTLRHINRALSGDPGTGWLEFFQNRYCRAKLGRGLSLGCGGGAAEREAIKLGLCAHIDAFDVAGEALDAARAQARKEGIDTLINYRIADLEDLHLGSGDYDIVLASHMLHHIRHLESLIDELKRGLRAGGYLLVADYIGPARLQWDDKQERLMNVLLECLPASMRVCARSGCVREKITRPAIEAVIAHDPSEAIRPQDIPRLLDERFNILYRADLGGTLLMTVLNELAPHFHEDDPKDAALIGMMSLFERTLIEEGVIQSDFAYFIAQK
ncbi:MAG: class I SAM-dependent methyltransferase [bacterium]|nr:class I SAM-dependent methyltransferase [Candidatus Sumerlaeota bacterium]